MARRKARTLVNSIEICMCRLSMLVPYTGRGTGLDFSVCFSFFVLTNCSVCAVCVLLAMKEYLRGTLEREPDLVWLSVSESSVYRGGRGERCSSHHGGQETIKEGERETETQKIRETKAES